MNGNTEKNETEKAGLFSRFKAFWKGNSDTVSKLYIHQFGLTVFGILLYHAAAASGNVPLTVGLGIFSALFYLVLIYVLAWDVGAKDKIRIEGGRLKLDKFKGARIAALGMLPNLFIAVLALIGFILKVATGLDFATGLYGISQLVGVYLNGMYLGIGDVTGIAYQPYYLFVICLPCIAVCGAGYRLGTLERLGVLTGRPYNGKKR
jgi:hypothetical protein